MIKPDQEQYDASFLKSLPQIDSIPPKTFVLDTVGFKLFSRGTASRPRTRELFRFPLVLMKQAPGPDRSKAWAVLSFSDVVFNQSFHGYSAAEHPEGELLARYLHLFAHSVIRLHYALITAPRFGSERRVLDKSDLDECPFIPLERLSPGQKKEIFSLSNRLLEQRSKVFDDIDRFFAGIYSLEAVDLEVIRDTLEVCLPYEESRQRACQYPTTAERDTFCRRLESLLKPFLRVLGTEAAITAWEPPGDYARANAPFNVLLLGKRGHPVTLPKGVFEDNILALANETGASRITFQVEGGVAIGILNQYRYWTPSRARLLSAEILRYHAGVFEQ